MTRAIIDHGTCLTGLGLIGYALWSVWPPLAYAAGGALLCAFGLFLNGLTAHKIRDNKGQP